MRRMRRVSLAGPLLVATLSMSAVNRELNLKPNAAVGVDKDDFA